MAHWGQMSELSDQLVELQRIDTLADQLKVQRERSPLRSELAEVSATMRAWEQRHGELTHRIDELNTEVEHDEERGTELAGHLARLERQLKTVIAPREAEALMHEIATITGQRDGLDIAELEAMEEQATLEAALAAHLVDEPVRRASVVAAESSLGVVVADIDQQLEQLTGERSKAVEGIPVDLMSRYDRARPQLGIVVSHLVGKQCTGCHLELSAAEIDTARADAADSGFTDCPQCGRILVI